MRLRGYEAGDVEAMYALDVRCFAPEFKFSRSAMKRFAEAKKARVVVAEEAGAMVGFCIAHVERDGLAYVVTLDVAPEARRRGVARALMCRVEEIVREAGCSVMGLHVFVGNAEAIRVYEALGYEALRTDVGFYGVGLDAQAYLKRLP